MTEDQPERTVPCAHCRRRFYDNNGLFVHMKARHPDKKRNHLREPEEPSIADLFLDAQINRAMGEPNPDWLEDMLP